MDKLAAKRTRTRAGSKKLRTDGIFLGIDRASLINSWRIILSFLLRSAAYIDGGQ
jgi:hypothetical protein